jgi:arylsulfatase
LSGLATAPERAARRRSPGARLLAAALLLTAGCAAPEAGPRLLLLVTVDTLRADHLGAYGSDRGLTPRLDALAARSVVFESAYAPSSHTMPSVAAVFTGRYPEELGIWSNLSVVPPGTPTLAAAFRDAGWNTAAVVSSWVLREASGLGEGFASYDDTLPQVEATRPIPERVGDDTTRAALAALDRCLPDTRARCLLWIHYQDPHGPYTPPDGLRERHLEQERSRADGRRSLPKLADNFSPGGIPDYQYLPGHDEVAFYRAGYAGEVAHVDTQVGVLLAAVEERGLTGATAVVFTADHGESLGEHDRWFAHGELLTEEQVRVPLLVHVPGLAPGRRGDLASLVDVWPTLAERLLAGGTPAGTSGRSLLAEGAEDRDSEPYLATLSGSLTPRVGLVDPEFKYVASRRGDLWAGHLTKRGRDAPDLSAPAPQLAAEMRARLDALVDRYRVTETESRNETGEAELRQLEALGYVDRSTVE